MNKLLFLLSLSVLMGICLIGCAQPKSTHNRICTQIEKKGLKQIAKYHNGRVTKSGKEGAKVHCECLSKGLATILTSDQYEEMAGLMSKASHENAFKIRNNYLKSLSPRGTRHKDRPFETVNSTCKNYMKVWRNSYITRETYTPSLPY